MSSGSVANARELEAIGHEVQNLRRRIADREDEELAIMERRETLAAAEKDATAEATTPARDRRPSARGGRRRAVHRRGRSRRAAAERPPRSPPSTPRCSSSTRSCAGRRRASARRRWSDGVCQGCHEQLSAVELSKIRPPTGSALRVLPADIGPVTDPTRPRGRELDGAARGNPGPAGAGAIVVERRALCSPRSPRGSGRPPTTWRSTRRRSVGSRRPSAVGATRGVLRSDSLLLVQPAHRPIPREVGAPAASAPPGEAGGGPVRSRHLRARPARAQHRSGSSGEPRRRHLAGRPVALPAGRSRPGGRGRFGARGKSGLHRAGCWREPGGGDLAEAQQKAHRRARSPRR